MVSPLRQPLPGRVGFHPQRFICRFPKDLRQVTATARFGIRMNAQTAAAENNSAEE